MNFLKLRTNLESSVRVAVPYPERKNCINDMRFLMRKKPKESGTFSSAGKKQNKIVNVKSHIQQKYSSGIKRNQDSFTSQMK